MNRTAALSALAAVLAIPLPGHAGVIGSLANFDVVNDTGKPAYGFEIEIEDPLFDTSKVTDVFGLNRDFGLPGGPGAVTRYGIPLVENIAGGGVRITYGGSLSGPFTPTGTFNTPGESCWPLAGGWSTAAPCDHFGVSTLGQPAVTRYHWLVETSPGSGVLGRHVAGLPAVQFGYTPPQPNPVPDQPPLPANLNVVIQAVAPNPDDPENDALWGEPFWVKTFTTKVARNVELPDLFRGEEVQEAAEVESEWSIFQLGPAGHGAANEFKEVELELGDADKAVVRRYEFYKYLGPTNPEDGEVICDTDCENDPLGLNGGHPNYVGDLVGQQMAGFNVAEHQQPIPEPSTWAMMLAGLAALGAIARQRRC